MQGSHAEGSELTVKQSTHCEASVGAPNAASSSVQTMNSFMVVCLLEVGSNTLHRLRIVRTACEHF